MSTHNNSSQEFSTSLLASPTDEKADLDAPSTDGGGGGVLGRKKLSTLVIIRIVVRLVIVGVIITLIATLKLNIRSYIDSYVSQVDKLGSVGGPVVFCIAASVWCGLSPMGYLPTVIAGMTFAWYVAPLVAYASVNIGSTLNVLFIRHVVLRHHCCQSVFKFLFGEKMGKISYLEKVLVVQPIKIVMLARFPYLSNGLFNYMFSLSSVKLKDCAIGNAIGFIPGSILFSVFGTQIRSLATIVDQGVDNPKQLALFIVICFIAVVSYGVL
ncbi:hypothetical protein RFI_05142, partial [Reticulomyxa filosa]